MFRVFSNLFKKIEKDISLNEVNIGRLLALSDERFKKIILKNNESHIENYVKQTGHFPECECCKDYISKPEDLVKEQVSSFHTWCFEPIYNNESRKKFPEQEQKYFDRLIKVFS